MTEKEKMIHEEIYDGGDKQLVEERAQARLLCRKYEQLDPLDLSSKQTLIKNLFGSIEEPFTIEAPFHCDYGYNIHVGHHFYCNCNATFLDCAKIHIGNHVFIGPNVGFYGACHPLSPQLRNEGQEWAKTIVIEDNVWIGGSVCLLGGVTIGQNCVIGAGSVVTKSIPANAVAAGNPCRVIRFLTEEELNP